MFLNFFKKFIVKRKLKKAQSLVNSICSSDKIETVGLLVDETYFFDKEQLLLDLSLNGIQEQNISVVLYHDKDKKRDTNFPSFSLKQLSWSGNIQVDEVTDFMKQSFDLLISYYDVKKPQLVWITQQSKAKYKVGFSSIDKKINHLMIDTTAENNSIFVSEMFRYLKILNKI